MVLSPIQKTRTAFEIAKVLPPETLEDVSRQNELDTLEKVARVLAETYTPSWIFYYLSEEAEGTEEVGECLVEMVSTEKIEEELDNQLDVDVSINLRNPASHNWMSDDPMKSFREEFNSQKQSLKNNLQSGFSTALESVSDIDQITEEEVSEFVDTYSTQISESVNYVHIYSLQEEGKDPSEVILSDMMDISLAGDFIKHIGKYSEEESDLTKEVMGTITLPRKHPIGH